SSHESTSEPGHAEAPAQAGCPKPTGRVILARWNVRSCCEPGTARGPWAGGPRTVPVRSGQIWKRTTKADSGMYLHSLVLRTGTVRGPLNRSWFGGQDFSSCVVPGATSVECDWQALQSFQARNHGPGTMR